VLPPPGTSAGAAEKSQVAREQRRLQGLGQLCRAPGQRQPEARAMAGTAGQPRGDGVQGRESRHGQTQTREEAAGGTGLFQPEEPDGAAWGGPAGRLPAGRHGQRGGGSPAHREQLHPQVRNHGQRRPLGAGSGQQQAVPTGDRQHGVSAPGRQPHAPVCASPLPALG